MPHDFDEIIDLRNTHSQKWDGAAAYSGVDADDLLPMWVADMDFRAPASVTAALQTEVSRGVYGYIDGGQSTRQAVCAWMKDTHGWAVDPDWIQFSNGVVHGLAITLETFTRPGDGVILFTPVYHAFARKILAKDRVVVESPLACDNGRYRMDFDALATSLTGSERMVILCSPHNPGGVLWTKDEIRALAAFCADRDLILVSDEIHMDLTFPGHSHNVTALAAPEATQRLVTLSAASKGFNTAGGETAFIIVEDPALRAKLARSQASHGGSPNRYGMLMLEAAFRGGAEWSRDVRGYIAENYRLFRDGVNAIPGISVMEMNATYLAWVDFAGTGMTRQEFTDRVQKQAHIIVNPGPAFGTGGETFLRFNIATRRALVEEAVERLQRAFADLQ